MPYKREVGESGSTDIDDRARECDRNRDGGWTWMLRVGLRRVQVTVSPMGCLDESSAMLRAEEDDGGCGTETRSGNEYYNKKSLGRASVANDWGTGVESRFGASGGGGRGRRIALGIGMGMSGLSRNGVMGGEEVEEGL